MPGLAWSTSDYLLATAVDYLAGANWQRGGGKGRRPRPVERPGKTQRTRMGKARPLAEAQEILARWRAGQLAGARTTRSRITRNGEVKHGRRD